MSANPASRDAAENETRVDTSDEACAVICMLVSNPEGTMRLDGDGWQRRVNDLIRALRDERNELVAALTWFVRWHDAVPAKEFIPGPINRGIEIARTALSRAEGK